MIAEFDVVFFDAGGTLFHAYPSVGQIYHGVATRYGATCDPQSLDLVFREKWITHDGAQRTLAEPDLEAERLWWRALVHDVFSGFGGVPEFETFFSELYPIFGTAAAWRVFPGVADTLAELKRRGKRLGIISNWNENLPHLCSELGLADYFDVVVSSGSVGVAKPGARIFETAMRAMEVEPHRAVHVGDSVRDDVEGARRTGLAGILIDRSADRGDHEVLDGVPVIHDLAALLEVEA